MSALSVVCGSFATATVHVLTVLLVGPVLLAILFAFAILDVADYVHEAVCRIR